MAINQDQLQLIIDNEFIRRMNEHHLSSINTFYSTGIEQICRSTFEVKMIVQNTRTSTPEDQSIDKFTVEVVVTGVTLKKPQFRGKYGSYQIMMPKYAREHDVTYSGALHLNLKISAVAHKHNGDMIEKSEEIKDLHVANIPIMVRSKFCNTYKMTASQLSGLGEDPTDPGGYCIVKGLEWAIDNLENIKYNSIHAYQNIGHKTEVARAELISKPGDAFENSSEVIVALHTDGRLTCRVVTQRFHKDQKEMEIPFFLIFRALGITSDREIFDHIAPADTSSTTGRVAGTMREIVKTALLINYVHTPGAISAHTQNDALFIIGKNMDFLATQYNEYYEFTGDAETKLTKQQYVLNKVAESFDKYFLPHMGLTRDHRVAKLRYFGYIINHLLGVHIGTIPGSDRDSYGNKRIHPAGVSYSKSFKTQYNFVFIQKLRKAIQSDLAQVQFSNIHWSTIVRSLNPTEFEKALMQAITSSESKLRVRTRVFTNHLSAQMVHRKNSLNVISTLRQVTSPNTNVGNSKSSVRADRMRRVHPSYTGYICVLQSHDTGAKVGMLKQMALSASITNAGYSAILRDRVLTDKSVYPLDKISPQQIADNNLARVMVNGEWVGCTADSPGFVKRYRDMRRAGTIDIYTTIQWDFRAHTIHLWVDVGRIVRPLLIVYSNDDPHPSVKPSKSGFEQYIMLTQKHLDGFQNGTVNVMDLIREGVMEYISAEEQQVMLLSEDYSVLMQNRHNPLKRYSHCDIPQAIIGLAASTSPYCTHNQLARDVYQTNQVKQTCSWCTLNWKSRTDKETFLQYHNEEPIIRTMANKYITPGGSNVIVALMTYGGFNQEDSLLFNSAAVKRGLFIGSYFSNEKTVLERNESFIKPTLADTDDMRANANYNKIGPNGMIESGTVIESNDVIIGKRILVSSAGGDRYSDRSIVYTGTESAIVENVITGENQDGDQICKVVYRCIRPVDIGDKFSSRAG